MSLTCLLIGQDNLLIQCGKHLLEKNHHIKWVVSPLQSIQSWCEKNNISWVASLKELPADKEHSVDYLFSIVNGIILKEEDLKIARYGAINYHDSPLPKYAGVNATTWAIMNGEKSHGITWHMVNEGIDEGDIVYQTSFPLAPNETALTLNLRCFDEATKGFSEIIRQIETASLHRQPQQTTGRSYYGLTHVLPDFGFINWSNASAASIEAQCRALNFGNYSNNVGLLKLSINHSFLIILDVEIATNENSSKQSGVVLALEKNGLLISTTTQPILIKKLMNSEGKVLSIDEVISQYKLSIHDQLPQIDSNVLKDNHSLYSSSLKNEKFWLANLANTFEHTTFSDRILNLQGELTELEPIQINLSNASHDSSFYLLASVVIYLYRLNNYENATVFLSPAQIPTIATDYSDLFAAFLPFTLELQSALTNQQVLEAVALKLDAFSKRGTFLNDIYTRQPALASLSKDCLITLSLAKANLHQVPKNSLVHFQLDENASCLRIYHRINTQYQGGTITPLVDNMSEHLNNILQSIVISPDQPIHQIDFLTTEERNKLISWSVGEYIPLPSNSLNELFERHVQATPNHAAICQDNQVLNYSQLWQESEKIAVFIQSLNLAPQTSIGIYLSPSANLITLLLGVFKAGCVAVPLEVGDINDLDLSSITILFSTKRYLDRLKNHNKRMYDIDMLLNNELKTEHVIASQAKQAGLKLNNQLLTPTSLINYCLWLNRATQFTARSIFNLSISVPFDLSISCILAPLLAGGTLVFSEEENVQANPERYIELLRTHKVSHVRIASTDWENLLTCPQAIEQLGDLKYLLLTTELKDVDAIHTWLKYCPQSQFIVLPNIPN